jgi:fructokinase
MAASSNGSQSKLILVCGEALVDVVVGEGGRRRRYPGGGPFNTSRGLARLGVPTAFVGRLSEDPFGRWLACLLEGDGASLAFASVGAEPTTLAVAKVNDAGQAAYDFHIFGTSAPSFTLGMMQSQLPPTAVALHVGTLGLVLEPMASTMVTLVKREGPGRLVMLDPNIRPALVVDAERYCQRLHSVIGRSTIVKASDEDLAWLYPHVSHQRACETLLGRGVRLVVVTLGERGAYAAMREAQVNVQAPKVDVVDTIGAGDAFGAALLTWLYDKGQLHADFTLNEAELRSALEFACLAASITCGREGAEPPFRAELVSRLHELG